jgi:hypothetical protein
MGWACGTYCGDYGVRDLFEGVGGPHKHESSRRRMEHAEWIDLTQDVDIWLALVNTVMNL